MAAPRFDDLVRTHIRAVRAYANALCSDPWLAEDAVQETFLRAWRYQDSFRGSGSYEGWLLRICRHVVVDVATGKGTKRLSTEPLPSDTHGIEDPRSADAEGTVMLDDVLRSLPIAQREVVAVCGVLGYDYASAATLLGVPIGTVRSRLNRARTAIANALAVSEESSRIAGGASRVA